MCSHANWCLKQAKLTVFEAFVDRHVDLMRDSLLTILFCLFCIAIALLRCILAFGRHDSQVREHTERDRISLVDQRIRE